MYESYIPVIIAAHERSGKCSHQNKTNKKSVMQRMNWHYAFGSTIHKTTTQRHHTYSGQSPEPAAGPRPLDSGLWICSCLFFTIIIFYHNSSYFNRYYGQHYSAGHKKLPPFHVKFLEAAAMCSLGTPRTFKLHVLFCSR